MTYIRDKPSSSSSSHNTSRNNRGNQSHQSNLKTHSSTSSSPQQEIPEGRVRVLLPRLALQIQSGTVRYDYRHSIANADLLSDRRVSITFRANAHPFHNVS